MSDEPWQLADKVEGWVHQEFTSYIGKREGLVALLADALAEARREGAAEALASVEAEWLAASAAALRGDA